MKTRTGNLPIGWRRRNFSWEKDLASMVDWGKSNGLEVIDLGTDGNTLAKQVLDAGMRVGTVDLAIWKEMISADKGKRADAVAKNAEYIKQCAALGVKNFFIAMVPEDKEKTRSENFGYMVESYSALAPTFEANKAHLVIEGWPGPGALVCTPEGYRAFIEKVGSKSMGINYDPSHLVRMGIDPIRFLEEFISSIFHVHGKDCMIDHHQLYEYGNYQAPTFGKEYAYGSMHWRYTIPGHGVSDWVKILNILAENGYQGAVCIELEDAHYDDTAELQKLGVTQGAKFLAGC